MPDIRVSQPHALPVDEARGRMSGFEEMLGKYGVKMRWNGPRADLAGIPGVGGHVEVRADEVEILVTLSRMVTMMGIDPARLEGSIRRRLAAAFDGA